jgi:NDP-sugar pyrophosphorylase family protein
VLSCGYRVDDIPAALGPETFGARLGYAVEPEPLGTGGGVRNAAAITRGTVHVLNGDILTDVDLGALRAFHVRRRARVTILLARVADPRPYGLVETAADGRVTGFREKPGPGEPITTDTINAGVYLIEADLLQRMPAGKPVSIEREFFPTLIAEGVACFACVLPGYWRDIGSPAAYLAAHVDLLDGRLHAPLPPPGEARDGVWAATDAVVAREALLVAPVVLGRGATVEPGARIGPRAVLGDGCRVATGAEVEDAVLWERVVVGASARLAGCVVGADVRIGAGARVAAGTVLPSGAEVPDEARLAGGGLRVPC